MPSTVNSVADSKSLLEKANGVTDQPDEQDKTEKAAVTKAKPNRILRVAEVYDQDLIGI